MKKSVYSAALASLALLSGLPLGFAQSAPADTVVLPTFSVNTGSDRGYQASNSVSATRIQTPIKDLPFAVTALTQEFIDDLKPLDILDIVKYAPSVTSNADNFFTERTRMTIRGVQLLIPQRNGFVGARFVDPSNIARVEVVRGPASVLYGQINPGGLVNYITKQPQETARLALTQEVGSPDLSRTTLDATGPVTDDKSLLYRVVGLWEDRQQVGFNSDQERWMIAPTVKWKPTANSSLTIDYERTHTLEKSPTSPWPTLRTSLPWVYFPNLPEDFSLASNRDRRVTDTEFFSADFSAALGTFATIRAAYAHNTWDLTWLNSVFAVAQANGLNTRRGRYSVSDANGDDAQLEMAIPYHLGKNAGSLLVGAKYSKGENYNLNLTRPTIQNPPSWDLNNPATWNYDEPLDQAAIAALPASTGFGGGADSKDHGYYVVNQLALLNDRLKTIAGLRFSEGEGRAYSQTKVKTAESQSDAWTPQLGLLYALTPRVSAYASYSKSFQFQTGVQQVNNVPVGPLSPIIGEGYEGGLKFDFPEQHLSASMAVYDLNIDGFARNVFVNDPITGAQLFTTLQDGTQKSQGFELEGVWEVSEGFQILGSYSYTDAFYKKVGDPLLVGTQLPGSTNHLWNLWLRKGFTVASIKGNFFVAGGASYTGRKVTDQGAAALGTYLPDYTTYDITAGWSRRLGRSKVGVDLTVKNLTDEFYFPSFLTRGEPRRILLTLRWEH